MADQLALVTGGSAGIGYEIARLLAGSGHDLVITGSSPRVHDAAAALRADCSPHGAEVSAIQSDLATAEGNEDVVQALRDMGRTPDVLVLNAGIATGGASFCDLPLERHLNLIALNVVSPVRLAHALVPRMVERGGGRILLVSSLSAFSPTPYEGVYGPSKAFLSSFGHGLREELDGTGITLTILHPGAVATEFHGRAGMGKTAFGDNSWKNDPKLVARQGYDGMMAGVTSLIGGDEATQTKGPELKRTSEEEKAKRHALRARPEA